MLLHMGSYNYKFVWMILWVVIRRQVELGTPSSPPGQFGGKNLQGGSEKRNGRRNLYTTPNIQNHVNALYFSPLPLYLPLLISLSTKISKILLKAQKKVKKIIQKIILKQDFV